MKSEKGSITLYVLIACLFFVIILANRYVKIVNNLQTIEQGIKQIQESYENE